MSRCMQYLSASHRCPQSGDFACPPNYRCSTNGYLFCPSLLSLCSCSVAENAWAADFPQTAQQLQLRSLSILSLLQQTPGSCYCICRLRLATHTCCTRTAATASLTSKTWAPSSAAISALRLWSTPALKNQLSATWRPLPFQGDSYSLLLVTIKLWTP